MELLHAERFEEVAAWRDPWEALADGRNPFQSPLWLETVAECFPVRGLHLTLAVEGGRLRGALALRLREGGRMAVGLEEGHGDYAGPLLDDGPDAPEVASALVAGALRRLGVPRLRLRHVPHAFAPRLSGGAVEVRPCDSSWRVPCAGPFAEVYPTIHGKKRRHSLRQSWNHLVAAHGEVKLEDRAGPPPDAEALEAVFRFHRSRWSDSKYNDPAEVAFVRRLAARLADAGRLELTALRVGDAVAAAHFGFRDSRRLYYYNAGYDVGFERDSPGALLLRENLERACGRGLAEIDLLRGDEPYKKDWNPAAAPLADWTFFNPFTLSGRVLGWWSRLRGRASRAGRA